MSLTISYLKPLSNEKIDFEVVFDSVEDDQNVPPLQCIFNKITNFQFYCKDNQRFFYFSIIVIRGCVTNPTIEPHHNLTTK